MVKIEETKVKIHKQPSNDLLLIENDYWATVQES